MTPARFACSLAPLLLVACSTPIPEPDGRFVRSDTHVVEKTPPGLKIAFIGDQGMKAESRQVLELIKAEGARAVLHQGDFDYQDDPDGWTAMIDEVLGKDFPYFASVGNHDKKRFYGKGGYQERLAERMQRIKVGWSGDLAVRCSIHWRGLFMVFVAPGLYPGDHAAYLRDELARDGSRFKIASWHVNQNLMQVGGKKDEAGWDVYEAARRGGAVIATGHEHSYSRTFLLSRCEQPTVADKGTTLRLARDLPETPGDEGRSFVFVSGISGHSIRKQQRSGDWWASVRSADQGANHGALFAVFGEDGNPDRARFYFKELDGKVTDEFVVLAR